MKTYSPSLLQLRKVLEDQHEGAFEAALRTAGKVEESPQAAAE